MTKKRFRIFGEMVTDTKDIVPTTLWQNEEQKQKYCDELNELHEENEHLKQSFKEVLKDLEVTIFDKELLEKENEQLKTELKALRKKYNDFSDAVDKRLQEMGL